MGHDRERVKQMTGLELRRQALDGLPLISSGYSVSIAASADRLSSRMHSQRDIAVIDAVSEMLGRDDWTVREIRDRLIFQVQEGVTTAILDGEPLLKIYPPKFEVKEEGPSTYLTAKQRIWRQNETKN